MSQIVDMTGDTIKMDGLELGTTTLSVSGTELNYLAGVTPGTVSASKAVVVDSSKTIDTLTVTSLTGTTTTATTLKLAAGGVIDADVATATLVTNAATITKHAAVITTEALTTAAGASQAFTITLTGVAASDLAFVQGTGAGTNTRHNHRYSVACSTNTITVTVYNTEPTNALNGTLVFNLMHVKAN